MTLKVLIATISTTFITLFGTVTPEIQEIPPLPLAEVSISQEINPEIPLNTPVTKDIPKNDLVSVYELGMQIGAIQEQIRQMEKQVKKESVIESVKSEPASVSAVSLTPITEPLQTQNQTTIMPQPQIVEEVKKEIPKSLASIEVLNKNFGQYSEFSQKYEMIAKPGAGEKGVNYDDSNSIAIDFIVRDDEGKIRRDIQVKVTATDESQNETINGTGGVKPIYIDGVKTQVSVYQFSYYLRTAGKHVITITTATGTTKTVELEVSEPIVE